MNPPGSHAPQPPRRNALLRAYVRWLGQIHARTGAPNYVHVILFCLIGMAAAVTTGWPALMALLRGEPPETLVVEQSKHGVTHLHAYPTLVAVACILLLLGLWMALSLAYWFGLLDAYKD